MDATYWRQKWEQNQTAFHQSQPNPALVNYFQELALPKGSRVFLPLCGKTLDIPWLLSKSYRVAGAELSQLAIEQLFSELGLKPKVSQVANLDHYSAENIDIFGGDIFDLTPEILGPIDAIYDRAALVALPAPTRQKYASHLMAITNQAPQLLVCYEYDQTLQEGPPFSVSNEEVRKHYAASYDLTLQATTEVPGGLKGISPAQENIWTLKKPQTAAP